MEIEIDSEILTLVSSLESDLKKAVDEGLFMWLKAKLTVYPITKEFCVAPNRPCNDCSLTKTLD
jgi:hypothetical protein